MVIPLRRAFFLKHKRNRALYFVRETQYQRSRAQKKFVTKNFFSVELIFIVGHLCNASEQYMFFFSLLLYDVIFPVKTVTFLINLSVTKQQLHINLFIQT